MKKLDPELAELVKTLAAEIVESDIFDNIKASLGGDNSKEVLGSDPNRNLLTFISDQIPDFLSNRNYDLYNNLESDDKHRVEAAVIETIKLDYYKDEKNEL